MYVCIFTKYRFKTMMNYNNRTQEKLWGFNEAGLRAL